MKKETIAPADAVEQTLPEMDECGCIIKPVGELITTKQPEAETAEETEEK